MLCPGFEECLVLRGKPMPDFTQEKILQMQIGEHVSPGDRADVYINVDRDVSGEDLARAQEYLRSGGLHDALVEIGATEAWPNILRVRFTRARRQTRAAAVLVPAPILIVGALAAIGIVAFAGVSVTRAVTKSLPLLIVAGTALAGTYIYLNRKGA